jgi:hypothetical protein
MDGGTPEPVLYGGYRMRSPLVADYARWLDALDVSRLRKTWQYQPQGFAGPGGQWVPDFGISHGDKPDYREYVEVQPEGLLGEADAREIGGSVAERINPVLARMSAAWLGDPRAVLTLVLWEAGAAGPAAEFTGTPWEFTLTGRDLVREGSCIWSVRTRAGYFSNAGLLWPYSIQPGG